MTMNGTRGGEADLGPQLSCFGTKEGRLGHKRKSSKEVELIHSVTGYTPEMPTGIINL